MDAEATALIARTVYASGFNEGTGNPTVALAERFAAALAADDPAFEREAFIRACTTR